VSIYEREIKVKIDCLDLNVVLEKNGSQEYMLKTNIGYYEKAVIEEIDSKLYLVKTPRTTVMVKEGIEGELYLGGTPVYIDKLEVKPARLVRKISKNTDAQKKSMASKKSRVFSELKSPLTGIVLEVKVEKGSSVRKGDVLFIIESMKMLNEIQAPRDGIIKEVKVSPGSKVKKNDVLIVFE